jgi:hypothetical protein
MQVAKMEVMKVVLGQKENSEDFVDYLTVYEC